jgi:DNA-binding GntR family transcriptional regulator
VYFVNTKSTKQVYPELSGPLHVELAGRISRLIHDEAMDPGTRLNEKRLAAQLGVSRTPVRAALSHLAAQGFVERKQNRGVELVARPPLPVIEEAISIDGLLTCIAADRRHGALGEQISEQDLMDRYELPRSVAKQALSRLADLGVIERKLGYRWRFLDSAYDAATKDEAYRFRMVMEPNALLDPAFELPPGWAGEMKARHEAFLAMNWVKDSSVAFFEMNAAFHEGLAAASHNRFYLEALQRLTRLRRLANYDWLHGRERVEASCNEHLAVLECLQQGKRRTAARLMRQHLALAGKMS